MTVDDVDATLPDDVADRAHHPQVELAPLRNFKKGQPASPSRRADLELTVRLVADVRDVDRHAFGIVTLGREQDGLVGTTPPFVGVAQLEKTDHARSEERRVGKECRARWTA